MKTVEEMYHEILADEALRESFRNALKAGSVEAFLKENGCNSPLEEVKAFLESHRELSDDELEFVTGGGCSTLEKVRDNITDAYNYVKNELNGGGTSQLIVDSMNNTIDESTKTKPKLPSQTGFDFKTLDQ